MKRRFAAINHPPFFILNFQFGIASCLLPPFLLLEARGSEGQLGSDSLRGLRKDHTSFRAVKDGRVARSDSDQRSGSESHTDRS